MNMYNILPPPHTTLSVFQLRRYLTDSMWTLGIDDWMGEPEAAAGLQLFRGLLCFLVHILSRSLTQYVIDFGPDSFIYLWESPHCRVGSYIKFDLYMADRWNYSAH